MKKNHTTRSDKNCHNLHRITLRPKTVYVCCSLPIVFLLIPHEHKLIIFMCELGRRERNVADFFHLLLVETNCRSVISEKLSFVHSFRVINSKLKESIRNVWFFFVAHVVNKRINCDINRSTDRNGSVYKTKVLH